MRTSATKLLYLDTSALAKLVLPEAESVALDRYLVGRGDLTSSALAMTELVRAARRFHPEFEQQVDRLLKSLILVDLGDGVLKAAGTVPPVEVRTLDAIHLATAIALGDELDALLTYDLRMIGAARIAGLHVETPA